MLDDLDRAVIHALHIDGRAPFSRIADVLDVSTQTVTRRYRRLRAEAGLRVVGAMAYDLHHAPPQPAPRRYRRLRAEAGLRVVGAMAYDLHEATRWMVRLTCTPPTAQSLARSLARRPDTSWVKLTSGGTEIFAIVDVPDGGH